MRMGLSNTNQMRLGYQIQIKCPQHQMHIKHTPNQMAIKYNEYNQMQLKYRSNTNQMGLKNQMQRTKSNANQMSKAFDCYLIAV